MNCPRCNGPLTDLGVLGDKQYYRCRNCGANCAETLRDEVECDWCEAKVSGGSTYEVPNVRDQRDDNVCEDCMDEAVDQDIL